MNKNLLDDNIVVFLPSSSFLPVSVIHRFLGLNLSAMLLRRTSLISNKRLHLLTLETVLMFDASCFSGTLKSCSCSKIYLLLFFSL